jgi:hypothetical protein
LLGATRDSTIHHCIADRRLLLLLLLLLLQPKTKQNQVNTHYCVDFFVMILASGFAWEAAAAAATRTLS